MRSLFSDQLEIEFSAQINEDNRGCFEIIHAPRDPAIIETQPPSAQHMRMTLDEEE